MSRSRRQDAKGRSTGARHTRLEERMLKSLAWRSMSVYSRSLYVELKRRYNGSNNGGISMSHREAERLLNCSNKPVRTAFLELQAKGFIRPEQLGSFDWKANSTGGRRATTWILTELSQDEPQRVIGATMDFMKWEPPT